LREFSRINGAIVFCGFSFDCYYDVPWMKWWNFEWSPIVYFLGWDNTIKICLIYMGCARLMTKPKATWNRLYHQFWSQKFQTTTISHWCKSLNQLINLITKLMSDFRNYVHPWNGTNFNYILEKSTCKNNGIDKKEK
jgi:hypothetical protein